MPSNNILNSAPSGAHHPATFFTWLALGVFLAYTVRHVTQNLDSLSSQKENGGTSRRSSSRSRGSQGTSDEDNTLVRRIRRLAGQRSDSPEEDSGASRERHARQERREQRSGAPEDEIPIDTLRTLADCPSYDIREAAIKIIIRRLSKHRSFLNSIIHPSTGSDPESSERQDVIRLLKRYRSDLPPSLRATLGEVLQESRNDTLRATLGAMIREAQSRRPSPPGTMPWIEADGDTQILVMQPVSPHPGENEQHAVNAEEIADVVLDVITAAAPTSRSGSNVFADFLRQHPHSETNEVSHDSLRSVREYFGDLPQEQWPSVPPEDMPQSVRLSFLEWQLLPRREEDSRRLQEGTEQPSDTTEHTEDHARGRRQLRNLMVQRLATSGSIEQQAQESDLADGQDEESGSGEGESEIADRAAATAQMLREIPNAELGGIYGEHSRGISNLGTGHRRRAIEGTSPHGEPSLVTMHPSTYTLATIEHYYEYNRNGGEGQDGRHDHHDSDHHENDADNDDNNDDDDHNNDTNNDLTNNEDARTTTNTTHPVSVSLPDLMDPSFSASITPFRAHGSPPSDGHGERLTRLMAVIYPASDEDPGGGANEARHIMDLVGAEGEVLELHGDVEVSVEVVERYPGATMGRMDRR